MQFSQFYLYFSNLYYYIHKKKLSHINIYNWFRGSKLFFGNSWFGKCSIMVWYVVGIFKRFFHAFKTVKMAKLDQFSYIMGFKYLTFCLFHLPPQPWSLWTLALNIFQPIDPVRLPSNFNSNLRLGKSNIGPFIVILKK